MTWNLGLISIYDHLSKILISSITIVDDLATVFNSDPKNICLYHGSNYAIIIIRHGNIKREWFIKR